MRAGDLDRRITLQGVEYIFDDYGGYGEVWTDVGTFWAEVKQESGREFFAYGGINSERKVIFRLRWVDGITVVHRVIYDEREHNIHEVRELGRQEGLELHTTASG
ncbi:MAG: phage head closure protein [Alphaproteobacteria bacterium]|nr:phage head closure protein [Alphaproteobacteria bacterium]